jgi:hypothetical protein
MIQIKVEIFMFILVYSGIKFKTPVDAGALMTGVGDRYLLMNSGSEGFKIPTFF